MNIARLVHPGFWFGKTPLEDALELARLGVGGFCLYGGTRSEVKAFTDAVRAASPHKKILISADYEDGLGRWLPDTELLPSNLALGAAGDSDLAFEKGLITAKQAKSLGVDWVFAPVLDLADNPQNPIVNTRSFGADPTTVIRLAGAFMDGLKAGGVLNSLKHFPGHGNTSTDSHLALPVLTSSKDALEAHELAPFKALLPSADSVMIGHLLVPALDKENPASVSRAIITDLLKQELGFAGCVITDALLMKALGDEKIAAVKAFLAGAHILLVPERPFELISFLHTQHLPLELLQNSAKVQDALCAQADKESAPENAFAPTELSEKTARKALTLKGFFTPLRPGETLYYVDIGNDEHLDKTPFLQELEAQQIHAEKFKGEDVTHLAILCWRRTQAFKGKIGFDAAELRTAVNALKQAPNTIVISFANPWLTQTLNASARLFTYCPAPAFQQDAARFLLGKQKAPGQPPVSL